MLDDRLLPAYSGQPYRQSRYPARVIELDGAPTVVGVDRDAVLWTRDLRDGRETTRPLDLAAAGPDDAWYVENGYWDEDDDEEPRERIRVDRWEIAACMTPAWLDGEPIVVTGGDRFDFSIPDDHDTSGGIVRAWDVRTGSRVGTVMIGHELGVCSMATVPYEHGLLSVSSCEAGTLRAWDLADGRCVAELEGSYNGEMNAALVNGRPVAVTGGHDDHLEAWDLLAGERIGGPLTGVDNGTWAIAIIDMGGRAVVLAADDDALVHMWDLATQERIGSPLAGHTDRIETLGTATVGGRAIAVTGCWDDRRGDGTTRVWDLARGEQVGEPLQGEQLQTVTRIDGKPVAVSASADGTVRVWDLARFG